MIFIDTNIYLDFYRTIGLRRLLPTLQQAAPHIFVTRQIADEVMRNKLSVASGFVREQVKSLGRSNIAFPDLVIEGDDLAEILNLRDEIQRMQADLRQRAEAARQLTLERVSTSTDGVSRALSPIMSAAAAPSTAQVERARFRREAGHPPGKRSDPLGDQLTWEQLLDHVQPDENVWVVSRDGDYLDDSATVPVLNSYLYSELVPRLGTGAVHCFTTLSGALKAFSDSNPAAVELPPAPDLEQIRKEETSPVVVDARMMQVNAPGTCPKCGAEHSFEGPWALRSRYGGLTEQFVCRACGLHYDTGIDWE